MRKTVFGSILMAALVMAASAWGQVAAPSLNPYSFVTENPAVMQWGSPSRVGVSAAQAQLVTDPKSATGSDNFMGSGGGVRLVGQMFSFAAEDTRFDSTNKPHGTAEFDEVGKAALAMRLGDHFALGAGQSNESQRNGFTGGSILDTHEIPQYGVSLRLGEWFFLGGAVGQDAVKHTDSMTATNNFTTHRDVTKYGVGIRTGGSVATHFEFYAVDSGKYANTHLTTTGHELAQTGVAELNFSGFLIGYATTHIERDSIQSTGDNDHIDVGYAPFGGWTVVLRSQTDREKFPAPAASKSTFTGYSLLVTYLFKS